METLIHPISGEQGYFCTTKEKDLVDVALKLLDAHLIVHNSSHSVRGVGK